MQGKSKYVLEERPESDVFVTDSGHIGIRQVVRGEQSMVNIAETTMENLAAFEKGAALGNAVTSESIRKK